MSGTTNKPATPRLRDFRVDQAPVLGVRPEVRSTPQQEVRSRASTLVEGRHPGISNLSADNLWKEWNDELGSEVDLSRPVARGNMNAAPSAPVPARRSPAAPAVQAQPVSMPASTVPEADLRATGSWAVELAHGELKMERSGEVDVSAPQQRHEILRQRTNEFVLKAFESFRREVEVFNEARRSPGQSIHVYRVSNTECDFMLFRNGVKLVVSGARAGRVVFAFNQYLGQIFGPNQSPTLEIEANFGAFDQLLWSYRGERVQIEDVVRYFLAEFVRQSFR